MNGIGWMDDRLNPQGGHSREVHSIGDCQQFTEDGWSAPAGQGQVSQCDGLQARGGYWWLIQSAVTILSLARDQAAGNKLLPIIGINDHVYSTLGH